MEIVKRPVLTYGIDNKPVLNGQEIGRGRLFLVLNELHPEPYGLIEDVFVEEGLRGFGIGTSIVDQLVCEAKSTDCYKVVACSRFGNHAAHELYQKMGFEKCGYEFRLDLGGNVKMKNNRKR
jgi:GNAT superfamily N-acetyltransferase